MVLKICTCSAILFVPAVMGILTSYIYIYMGLSFLLARSIIGDFSVNICRLSKAYRIIQVRVVPAS